MEASKKPSPTILLIRLAGYGMLALVLVDFLNLFIPFNFLNPVWEVQVIGALAERTVLPLLGFLLAFYGDRSYRSDKEFGLLRGLSWATLGLAVIYALTIPLLFLNTGRVDAANSNQALQSEQQLVQIRKLREQLNTANSPEQITKLFNNIPVTGNLASSDPQQLKENALKKIDETEKTLKDQSEAFRAEQRFGLYKNAFRWTFSAGIATFLFFRVWQITSWVRTFDY
jgi:hypothetical protein